MTEPRLTIVLPLKGRQLFTLRYLWYANEARLPYRFLIADGQVNEDIARYLENSREVFPNLDVEYVRYPDDTDYARFFAKMADALSRVRTPYVMLGDNDDFLGIDGIEQSLDFLEAHADYVCAAGRVAAFTVYSALGNPRGAVHGRLNRLYLATNPKDVTAEGAAARLRDGGLYHLIYYAVYRTEVLAKIWREVEAVNFSDLMLHENFHALRAITLGKFRANPATITHYAQVLTSLNTQYSKDWARHLVRSRFTTDVQSMIKYLSAAAAGPDSAEKAAVAENVLTLVEDGIRNFLMVNWGIVAQMKRLLRAKWPLLASWIQTRPRFSVGREKATLLSQLAGAGAPPKHLDLIRREIATIEAAVSPTAFKSFAGPFAKMAHADAARTWF